MTTFLTGIAVVLGVALLIPWVGNKVDQTIDELFDDLW